MKFLCLTLFLAISLQAFADENLSSSSPESNVPSSSPDSGSSGPDIQTTSVESNQGSRGSLESRNARSAARSEFRSALSELRSELRAARDERREAMKAARELTGAEKDAAILAAREAFKAKLEEIRAKRRAAIEKMRGINSNGEEAQAMAEANNAQKALEENASGNEAANAASLVAADGSKDVPEELKDNPDKIVAQPDGARVPASVTDPNNNFSGSRVSAQ